MTSRPLLGIGSIAFVLLLFVVFQAQAQPSSASPFDDSTAAPTAAETSSATPAATTADLSTATATASPTITATFTETASVTVTATTAATTAATAAATAAATSQVKTTPTRTPTITPTPKPTITPTLTPTLKPTVLPSIVVNTTKDEIDDCKRMCSLRGALATAKRGDIIGFSSNVTGTMFIQAYLEIITDVTIRGPGRDVLMLDASGKDQFFFVDRNQTLNLSGLTLQNSYGNESGGAIQNFGTLNVTDCTITKSVSGRNGFGGAIANFGTLTLTGSTISESSAADGGALFNTKSGRMTILNSIIRNNMVVGVGYVNGGAVSNAGTITITNTTISDNSAAGSKGAGGGLANFGTMTITGSTIARNSTGLVGGGLFNFGTATISNSTFSDNAAEIAGGAIESERPLTITNSTLAENRAVEAGGGIYVFSSSVTIGSDIIASNGASSGPNIFLEKNTNIFSRGYNLIGDSHGFTGLITSDQRDVDPLIDKLALNDPGTTKTIALQKGSPAIGAGGRNCTATDQRGVTRKRPCDVGAFESSP